MVSFCLSCLAAAYCILVYTAWLIFSIWALVQTWSMSDQSDYDRKTRETTLVFDTIVYVGVLTATVSLVLGLVKKSAYFLVPWICISMVVILKGIIKFILMLVFFRNQKYAIVVVTLEAFTAIVHLGLLVAVVSYLQLITMFGRKKMTETKSSPSSSITGSKQSSRSMSFSTAPTAIYSHPMPPPTVIPPDQMFYPHYAGYPQLSLPAADHQAFY